MQRALDLHSRTGSGPREVLSELLQGGVLHIPLVTTVSLMVMKSWLFVTLRQGENDAEELRRCCGSKGDTIQLSSAWRLRQQQPDPIREPWQQSREPQVSVLSKKHRH